MTHLFFIFFSALIFTDLHAAVVKPQNIHTADAKKTNGYIRDGLFVGGDRAVNGVAIKNIRRAANVGYDRVVVDLEGMLNGEPLMIPRAPYFQVAVSPEEKRLMISFWGNPKLLFDAKQVIKQLEKSPYVQKAELLPKVDEELWTFVLNLKSKVSVEVFELRAPVRLIMDIRGSLTQ